MKYLSPIIWLLISLFFSNTAQAETLPSASEVGNFFGTYMCESLITKGNMDDDKIMEQFAEDLILKYGEETTLKLIDKMELSEKSLESDSYGINLMKGAFNHIINNDPCFKIFVEQVF
ncbi:hypothetical protein [Geminocystis sp. NIES-3708]|uniref:hypothetical protein n=1 Tax=Geminocystis sp. NIES-3708 TaxID=1615909 RepID=UPI00082E3394|nr:hypothetical protein [Geminocystis sp. NIES-3708]